MVAVSVIGGSGDLGFGLATRLGAAGIPVTVGSRDESRAAATVDRLRERVPAGTFGAGDNAAAVAGATVVILTVPFGSQRQTLGEMSAALVPGQIVLDTTVPLASSIGGRPTRTVGVWQGSAAEQAAELVPAGVGVVSALHTVAASHLSDLGTALEQDVLVCGDSPADKRVVAELLERGPGLRCVDCGPLEMSRFSEQFTPLLIGLNLRYRAKSGLRHRGAAGDACGRSPARRRHGRRQARTRTAGRHRRSAHGDRQHR
jgi:NADPH-dependent F420 reductase